MPDFAKLTTVGLKPMAVVAQSLDNQWVPPELLRRMLKNKQELSDVRDELHQTVRAEYIRALINSQQVVVNRAFLYNNPIVFADFLPDSPNRDAFLKLLSTGVIVQMLVAERTPWDKPRFLDEPGRPDYTMLRAGWEAWAAAADESKVHSLRYSWGDDDANAEQIRGRLARKFTSGAQRLVGLEASRLARDLGVEDAIALEIKERLREIADRCSAYAAKDDFATRERLYAEFITAKGTDPALGRYDDSPFCAEIKQLIDLVYNVNLADGLDTLALTPADALHRSSLQEWAALRGRGQDVVTPEQLARLLRNTAFGTVSRPLYFDTFAKLSMQDVVDVRNSGEWRTYVERMNVLLADPLANFDDPVEGAAAVVGAYHDLLEETTRIALARSRPGRPEPYRREFGAVVIVEVAGAVLELLYTPGGTIAKVVGAIAGGFASEAVKATVRLGLRALGTRREQQRTTEALDNQFGVMSKWVDRADRFWNDLLRELKDIEGIDEARRQLKARAAVIEGDPNAEVQGALD